MLGRFKHIWKYEKKTVHIFKLVLANFGAAFEEEK